MKIMNIRRTTALLLGALGASSLGCAASAFAADRILIFTRTEKYREDNITPTRAMLRNFYAGKGLTVDTSETAGLFTDTTLAKYKAVVFLKTSGNALSDEQQAAFEKWFKAGGGFQAIHSALDTEYDWPFYGKMIGGAWFKSLPGDMNTKQTEVVEDSTDISTKALPRKWERTDEIYAFKANPRAAVDPVQHILVTVDESTFKNGVPGTDHPMSWYCAYQGGRAWTTAMGHVTGAYADSLFLGHLWGGMQYLLGRTTSVSANTGGVKHTPEAKRAWMPSGVRFGVEFFEDAVGRKRNKNAR